MNAHETAKLRIISQRLMRIKACTMNFRAADGSGNDAMAVNLLADRCLDDIESLTGESIPDTSKAIKNRVDKQIVGHFTR